MFRISLSVPVKNESSMPPALYSAMSLFLASWLEASLQYGDSASMLASPWRDS